MPTVYDPIKVGTMWLKNRFVVAPTVKNHALEGGFLNQRVLDNYEAEADGPGFVICGMSFTEPAGQAFVRQMGAHHDKCMGGLQNLAQVIHRQGAKCALQISHGGTLCQVGIIDQPVRGVSEKPFLPGQRPVPLTVGELEGVVENYAKAAARIKAAGFDGVELHACHGSLNLQFMSPLYNVGRWDKYADRTVLFAETVQAMRDAVGPDFPFGVRFSTHEFGMEDLGYPGQTIEETCNLFIPIAEKIGVDWIHASVGRIGVTPDHSFPPVYAPHGVNVKFAEACKKVAHVPVMAVGRLMDPKLIEKIIEDGQADMVAMCRPTIADQRFVKKMIEGRYDDIRKCIGCNYCLHCLFMQCDAECTMNPLYGREKVWEVTPAPKKKKKVMVVGGGVSGLQAALTASQRGHEVTLYEKSDKLGGQTNLAAAFPRLYTRDLMNVPDWLAREIKKYPVRIVMKTEVTPQLVEKEKPDAIVVATGAKETAPELPAGAKNVVYLWDYLRGTAKIGNKVVVLGGNDGAEAALSLARQGKEVTLVEKSDNIALPSYIFLFSCRREPLFRWMKEDKVTILAEHKVKAATGDTLTLADKWGVEKTVAYDTIVVAVGREPVNELYQAIATRGREVYLIGDAKEPRNMKDGNQEAFWVGRHI